MSHMIPKDKNGSLQQLPCHDLEQLQRILHPFPLLSGAQGRSIKEQVGMHIQNEGIYANTSIHSAPLQSGVQGQFVEELIGQYIQRQGIYPDTSMHLVPLLNGVQDQSVDEQVVIHIQSQGIYLDTSTPLFDKDACCRRLEQYYKDLRNRPKGNPIEFWRNFVSEYFAPCARERWCFSSYPKLGPPNYYYSAAHFCEFCGSSPVKGYEASFKTLPGLRKKHFDPTVGPINEILHFESLEGHIFPSGIIMLKCDKAIQECVYDNVHLISEVKVRISFRQDLKILSWDFCATYHEECPFPPLVKRQVHRLLSTPLKDTPKDKGTEKRDLNAQRNLFLKAGHTANKSGFSNASDRSLQIGEVMDMMKDLLSFGIDRNVGPIESLSTYVHENKQTRGTILKDDQKTAQRSRNGQYFQNQTSGIAGEAQNFWEKWKIFPNTTPVTDNSWENDHNFQNTTSGFAGKAQQHFQTPNSGIAGNEKNPSFGFAGNTENIRVNWQNFQNPTIGIVREAQNFWINWQNFPNPTSGFAENSESNPVKDQGSSNIQESHL